jgi:transposase
MSKIIEREVKVAYVKQIHEKKMTTPQAAKEAGVNEGTIYAWLKKYREDPENALPGSGNQKPEDEELRKLKEENKRLQAEIDFLKNVTAYFASDHKKSTL